MCHVYIIILCIIMGYSNLHPIVAIANSQGSWDRDWRHQEGKQMQKSRRNSFWKSFGIFFPPMQGSHLHFWKADDQLSFKAVFKSLLSQDSDQFQIIRLSSPISDGCNLSNLSNQRLWIGSFTSFRYPKSTWHEILEQGHLLSLPSFQKELIGKKRAWVIAIVIVVVMVVMLLLRRSSSVWICLVAVTARVPYM